MRELDRLLSSFLQDHYAGLSDTEIQRFEAILDLPDPELYGYVLGRDTPADPQISELIARIRLCGSRPA